MTKEECSIDLVIGLQRRIQCQKVYSGKWQRGVARIVNLTETMMQKILYLPGNMTCQSYYKILYGGKSRGGVYGHELSLDYQKIFNHYEIIVEEDMCNHDVSVKEIRKERNKKIIENEQFEGLIALNIPKNFNS